MLRRLTALMAGLILLRAAPLNAADASATFSLGTTTYRGPVTVSAAVDGGASTTLTLLVQ